MMMAQGDARKRKRAISSSENPKGVEPFPRFPITSFRKCLEKFDLL